MLHILQIDNNNHSLAEYMGGSEKNKENKKEGSRPLPI